MNFSFWHEPDALLAEAGAEGEWLAAKIRIVVVALLLITPFYRYYQYPWVGEYFTGLIVTLIGWFLAVALYAFLRAGRYLPSIGFLSASLDVTLVSIALFTFVLTGPPHAAANSRVTFPIYFLAIAATSLRYDRRICIAAGALTVVEYIGVIWYDEHVWGFNNPRYAPFDYGVVTLSDQFNRLVLLIAATILAHEIVRRAEGLRRASIKDMLTDLPNRAYAETRSLAEFSRARRYNQPLSIVAVDVDHFKTINDKYGHPAGDRALRNIADVLRENLRISDVVARFGGEEFLLILPQTDLPAAVEKIEDLLRIVEDAPLVPHQRVTISAGVACYPTDATELSDLLLEADRRLMRAKAAGRNRVISYSEQFTS
ncbi:MAG TPA: GGDEF domain-containing protein [Longimicrobiales bacterium]|nr:GGDEF domain-containing protein [Longimicrobiales bacterium]